MPRSPRALLLMAGGCGAAFAAVLAIAYWLPQGRWFDAAALHGFVGLRQTTMHPVIAHAVHLADPLPFAVLASVVVAVALIVRGPRHAAAVVVLLAVTSVASQALKVLLAYPRPFGDWVGVGDVDVAAFPSGHATASMALALAMVLIAPAALRPLAAVAGASFALVVSASVVSLGWHFPSDVAGGYLLAAGCALAVLAGLRAAEARWPHRGQVRRAARQALAEPSPALAIAEVAVPLMIAAALAAPYAYGAVTYAGDHTAFSVVAIGMALAAVAMNAGLAAISSRHR